MATMHIGVGPRQAALFDVVLPERCAAFGGSLQL